VFWAIQPPRMATILLNHLCLLDVAELYGDMLTCPHGHYDLWNQWRRGARKFPPAVRALIAPSEHETWPRGRIVFDTSSRQFTCYADAQILRRAYLLAAICDRFGLPIERTRTKSDSHYRSSMRLTSAYRFQREVNEFTGTPPIKVALSYRPAM
jgi:hypothetical protein